MRILFILLYLFCLCTVKAQHVFRRWMVEDGLPNNSINRIIQDSDGYIWIGTNGGLARFDGNRFTTFDIGLTKITGSHRILGLFQDSRKRLWIGTNGGGLCYYQYGVFQVFDLKSSQANHSDITQFYEDSDGNLFAGSTQAGLFVIKPSGEVINFNTRNGLYDNNIIGIFEDEQHRIWIAGHTGFSIYHNGKVLPAPLDLRSLGIAEVWFVSYFKTQNAVWGTVRYPDEERFRLFRYKDGKFSLIPFSYNGNPSPKGIRLKEDRDGRIYLSSGWGLLQLDARSGLPVHNIFSEDERLSTIVPIDVMEDKEHNKWIGTATDGLIMAKNNPFTHIAAASKGSENGIYCVTGDSDHRLWWSIASQLMCFQNGKEKAVYPRTHHHSGLVHAMGDTLYFDGFSGKLNYLYKNKVTDMHIPPEAGYWLKALIRYKGNLYAGTSSGIAVYDNTRWYIPAYASRLKDVHINRFYADNQGRLWICAEKGLFYLENDSLFSLDMMQGKRLAQNRCAFSLGNGKYLFGTYGKGLIYYNGRIIREITSLNGLPDNTVSEIVKVGNSLWLAGNKGLTKVPLAELYTCINDEHYVMHCTLFDKSDGLHTSEFNGGFQSTAAYMGNNTYAFATINGIAIVDFNRIAFNSVPPRIAIEEIKTDDRVIAPGEKIDILYEENRVEISFAILSFTSVKNNQFRYMLEGYDNKWHTTGAEQKAVYTHLPPGSYTFRVIASNNDGVWNMEGESLRFTIIPPFYLTMWFKVLVVSVVTLILLFIVWLSIHRIRRNERLKRRLLETQQKIRLQAMMETEEAERKRIAEDLHDGVGPLLSTVRLNLEMVNKTQPGNELIAHSKSQIDQITAELRNITYNLTPASLSAFGLSIAIKEFVMKLQEQLPISIYFEEVGTHQLSPSSQIVVFRTIQEIINNSIKHSGCTEINVQLIADQSTFRIMIEDNGRGFDLAKAFDKLQSRGLKNIYDRCSALGAKLHIDTSPGNGTTVTIEMKINA